MQVKVKAFPAVYLNTICTKHECPVEIILQESKKFRTTAVTGAQITMLQCKEGGPASGRQSCSDFWDMTILAGGEVTISQ